MPITSVLPNNYRKNNKGYQYKVVDGLGMNLFINSDDPIDYADFANLTLAVYDCYDNEIIVSANTLQKVDLGGGTYRIYSENILITGLVPNKSYRWKIYDTVTEMVLLYPDQTWQFVSDPDKYVRLSYRNSSNRDNYNYEELPDYRNIIYVDMNLIDEPTEYDITSEFDATTNTSRNQKTSLKDSVVLETYFFDEMANNAMKSISMHNDIEMNFVSYTVKKGYEMDYDFLTRRQKGTIEFWNDIVNTINYPS